LPSQAPRICGSLAPEVDRMGEGISAGPIGATALWLQLRDDGKVLTRRFLVTFWRKAPGGVPDTTACQA